MTDNKNYQLHLGDCLETLKTLPDNSVEAIVTDPPYGLSAEPDMAEVLKHWLAGDDYKHKGGGFMGKSWDSFVPGPSIWKECLRVLKPGGHLLAFAGTRTQDLMALSIRLAGFHIRDSIDWMHSGDDDTLNFVDSLTPAQRDAFYRLQDQGDARWSWTYGSGFPKSMDVSKAIDKRPGVERHPEFAAELRAAIAAAGYTNTFDVSEKVLGRRTGAVANWQKYQWPEAKWWPALRDLLGMDGDKWDRVIAEAERTKTGERAGNLLAVAPGQLNDRGATVLDITSAATEPARQWQGWGSALKPAHEPIVVARKPLIGTIAANVLAHGTGALNIDGCRVGTESTTRPLGKSMNGGKYGHSPQRHADESMARTGGSDSGRWPANLIHDGSDEVVALFPREAGASAPVKGTEASAASTGNITGKRDRVEGAFHGDKGSAARFFYCAKTSRRDRNEGLEDPGPQFKRGTTLRQVENTDTAGNNHPTVKPTDLMAYLCRLVTPPGGTVLDPFMGSGSTGKAAMREGFRFIGCELDPGYMEIARKRIEFEINKQQQKPEAPAQVDLFTQTEPELAIEE